MTILAVAASSTAAFAGTWHLRPHLEVLETYTDNVDLAPVNKQDDFITRLSPGLQLQGKGAKINLDVNYTANFLYFAKSNDQTDLRHDLAGRLNSELIDETLFLDAAASINDQFIDRGGAFSTNSDNRTQNRKSVQNYLLSPTLRHGFGSWGTGFARYQLNYIHTGADQSQNTPVGVIQNTTTHEWSVGFDSGRYFPRLQWGVQGDYQLRDRQGSSGSNKRTTLRANASYPVSTWLSLVGSVGYEKIDDSTLNRRPKGFIWDAGFKLHPGPRTTVSVRGGKRYNDTNFSVDGQYLFSTRTRLSASYHDTITTSQDLLARQLANSGQTDVGNNIPGTDFGNRAGGYGLINSSFRQKRTEASISGSRGRNSFRVGGYYETRDIDVTSEREKNWGGFAGFDRAIGPHLKGFLSGDYRRTQFISQGDRKDKIYSGQVGLNYTLSQNLSGGMEYLYNRRDSNQSLYSIKENAVRIRLSATF